MRRGVLMAAAVALLAGGCGGGGSSPTAPTPAPAPAAPSKVVALDSGNFEGLVLAGPRPSVVEFHLPTCPYCLAMVPILTRVAEEYEGRALVGTVDGSTQISLARAYGVNLVPTFVFFKNGREVSRIVGAMTYEELAGRLQALVVAP